MSLALGNLKWPFYLFLQFILYIFLFLFLFFLCIYVIARFLLYLSSLIIFILCVVPYLSLSVISSFFSCVSAAFLLSFNPLLIFCNLCLVFHTHVAVIINLMPLISSCKHAVFLTMEKTWITSELTKESCTISRILTALGSCDARSEVTA